MAARRIRVGVLGCGFYAQNHLHSWRDLAPEGADLVAVCDIDSAKAEAAGRSFDAEAYSDPTAFLDRAGLDLVDIVTRQDTHRALAEAAISRGIATIVQKPFAPTWEDCIAIVDAAKKADVWLAVHENFRFSAPMRRVRDIIDSGAIGTPNWARMMFRTGFDVYKTQPYFLEEERLVIADVGVHMLDLARFFMGEAERISCEVQRRNPQVIADDDTATMLLRHTSGAVSVVECTYEARVLPDHFPQTLLQIEGDRGSVVVLGDCRVRLTSDGKVTEFDAGAPLLPWTSLPWHVTQEAARSACRHFLDCVQRNVPAETCGQDNLNSYALVDAAYEAARQGSSAKPRRHAQCD